VALRRALLILTCAALAAIGARADTLEGSTAGQGRLVQQTVGSAAVGGTLRYGVYLPAGYDRNPRRRYPVLYALHGLPGDAGSYLGLAYLTPVLDRLHAQAIVVFPQGATDSASDDEYLDLGPDRNWETALTRDLPTDVARHYRVLTGRDATGILGISAGGYGAAALGLHHLDRYRVVESWSGYFHATSPDGTAPMSLAASKAAYADLHALVGTVARQLRNRQALIAFYTGADDPYPGFVDENRRFDRELAAANVPHRFAVYAGGHDRSLWLAHARDWLSQALRELAPAR
jgi:S-formylglutathione hydrolase FrmB